ncbi:MAG TPA: hypothetical protein VNZ49_12550 [Bacteroidia bacterium]|nr:hypothetical protein [Bacteroidia bacterium]
MSVFFACKKDPKITPNQILVEAPVQSWSFACEDTTLIWPAFPPEPAFGFNFADLSSSESVWRVVPDPIDGNVIYYLNSEKDLKAHCLWKYNIKTKQRILLDKNVMNDVFINQNGWLVYETMDWNIYKIKGNGDSLTQLTFDGGSKFPRWTDDGKFIWYVGLDCVHKMDANGVRVNSLNGVYSWVVQIKHFLYYVKSVNNVFSITERDTLTNTERNICSGENAFNWYPNEDNTIMYWWNPNHLYKTNISSGATTLLFYCQGRFHHFLRSPVSKHFFAIDFNLYPVDSKTIKQTGQLFEFSEDLQCRRKILLPN